MRRKGKRNEGIADPAGHRAGRVGALQRRRVRPALGRGCGGVAGEGDRDGPPEADGRSVGGGGRPARRGGGGRRSGARGVPGGRRHARGEERPFGSGAPADLAPQRSPGPRGPPGERGLRRVLEGHRPPLEGPRQVRRAQVPADGGDGNLGLSGARRSGPGSVQRKRPGSRRPITRRRRGSTTRRRPRCRPRTSRIPPPTPPISSRRTSSTCAIRPRSRRPSTA